MINTLQRPSSPALYKIWEVLSAKATVFTSLSWPSIYKKKKNK